MVCVLLALCGTAVRADETDPSLCEFNASWGDIEGRNPTIMFVRQNQAQFDNHDQVFVAFFNNDWSISKGDPLGKIKVANGAAWFSNDAIALEHGFVVPANYKTVAYVFDDFPTSLVLTRGGKTIDRLSASELFSDWISFKACRAKKVTAEDEMERKRRLEREIPRDPFSAKGKDTPPK